MRKILCLIPIYACQCTAIMSVKRRDSTGIKYVSTINATLPQMWFPVLILTLFCQ